MTDRWRAEMPPRHLGRVNASELTCHADDVESLKDRANAELDAAEAEVTALRSENRELREKVAALETERDAAFRMSRCECASDEACRNLVAKDERIAVLESRIRELTEWQPMETAPNKEGWVSIDPEVVTHVRGIGPRGFVGWLPTLPLPSTEGGEG